MFDARPLSRREFVAGSAAAAGGFFMMNNLPAQTPPPADFDALRKACRGVVATPADANFSELLHGGLWNRLIPADRAPQVIVRVADEHDVVTAVRFARAHTLKVVVRGGGHNWSQPTLRRGGLLIDLGELKGVVSLDVENRKAVIQPIISNRETQRALNAKGLSFPSGHCPQVKASGYFLGGGMAWNPTVWGSGAENVEAIELVTAQGELIKASETENSDYFWAALGAGYGFFGVVTKYYLKLYPLPKAIHGSTYYYSMDDAAAVGAWLGEAAPKISPSVELSLFLVEAPAELREQAAAHGGKICMVTGAAFEDTPDAAKAALQPLEDGPVKPLSRTFAAPTDFEQMFDASGALWPEGVRAKVEATFSDANPGDLVRLIREQIQSAPSPTTVFLFTIFCGPDVPAKHTRTALSASGKIYGGPWTMWWDAADDEANIAWHRKLIETLRPHNAGYYIGESNAVDRPATAAEAFATENWQRLADLRDKYDPDGVFFGYFDGLA